MSHNNWTNPSYYVCWRCNVGPCDIWLDDKKGETGSFPRILDDLNLNVCPTEDARKQKEAYLNGECY